MSKGNTRLVSKIERAFIAYSEQNVKHVSFTQLRDWLNSNTKDGISSPRLGSMLRRTPKFVKIETYRRVGTNTTETLWALEGNESEPEDMAGWVRLELP